LYIDQWTCRYLQFCYRHAFESMRVCAFFSLCPSAYAQVRSFAAYLLGFDRANRETRFFSGWDVPRVKGSIPVCSDPHYGSIRKRPYTIDYAQKWLHVNELEQYIEHRAFRDIGIPTLSFRISSSTKLETWQNCITIFFREWNERDFIIRLIPD